MSPAADDRAEPPTRGGSLRLLVALALACALGPINSTMMAVALPAIGRELSTDATTLTHWLVSSYLLVAIVAQSPSGKLGDLLGHGRMLYGGQLAVAVGTVLGLVANGVVTLACARMFMAVGGAVIVPSAMALVRTRLPVDRRAQAFGAFTAVMALSAGVGPALGGEIAARFGWRAIFLVNAPPLAASALLAAGASHRPAAGPIAARPTFDVCGSLLLGLGLALFVIGLDLEWAAGALLAALGIAVLVAFGLWERRAREPVVDLALLRRGPFLAGMSIIALQNIAFYGLLFQLPFFFGLLFAVNSAETGWTLVVLLVMVVLMSPLSGSLSRRFGPRWIVLVGCLLATAGVLLLAFLPAAALETMILPLALIGAGMGLSSPPSQAAAMNAAAVHQGGMAAGLMTTMRYLGGVCGVAIFGLVLRGDAIALASRHRALMAIFAAFFAVAAGAAAALPRHGSMR